MVNIPAILIVNLMGLMILFVIAVGNSWQRRTIFSENKSFRVLFWCCLVLCFVDPICFLADGQPGVINYILVYWCNVLLFVGNIIVALMFVKLIIDRLDIKPLLIYKIVIGTSAILNVFLIILNFFVPIIFYVDEFNVYHRADWNWLLTVFYVLVILFGLYIYFIERRRSGNLKFFPVWVFLIPASVGMVIQMSCYGVSTIIPFVTVGLGCVYICLQSEFIYRDKLTGLYNRFYARKLEHVISKQVNNAYSAMMLDLNDFKAINDTFGHAVGDHALILFSQILRKIVGARGEVVRYAGDEFIIILHTQEEEKVQGIINEIHKSLAEASKREDVPYTLSVSIGFSNITKEDVSMDTFIDKIDKLMYENKREYYKANKRKNAIEKG